MQKAPMDYSKTKQYYQEKLKEKIECEYCSKQLTKGYMTRHHKICKSKPVKNYIEELDAKTQPQPQPQPKPQADYRISVINKMYDQHSFDFNFTRDFKYKTIKTDLGYDFIFKNINDYNTAKSLTTYSMNYKNPRLYKWIYHNDILKTTQPKPQLKPQPKPQLKPQPKPQPQPKKDDVIKSIVYEWDMLTITYLLDQTGIGNMTNTIKTLVKKKKIIFPPDLFYSSDGKILLEELIKHYSIQEIDEVIIDYIGYIADDAKFPPYKDYYHLYQKRLKKSTLTKILKSTSPLCKRQAKEIEFKKIFV